MKTIILLLAIAFAAGTVNAQTAEELIGKWKLASWTLKGKEMDIKSTFKTEDVFQIFKEGNEFVSMIGNKLQTEPGRCRPTINNLPSKSGERPLYLL